MEKTAAREAKPRLIVLVPGGVENSTALARRVHQMAVDAYGSVLYLMLVEDADRSLSVSREMATMKAVTAGNRLAVETLQVASGQWRKTLRSVYRPGDVLACLEEHEVRTGLFRSALLRQQAAALFDTSVLVISGMYRRRSAWENVLLRGITIWSGFLSILVGFAWLEILLARTTGGPVGKIFLVIFMFLAFGALWTWNDITCS